MLGKRAEGVCCNGRSRRGTVDHEAERLPCLLHHVYQSGNRPEIMRTWSGRNQHEISDGVCCLNSLNELWRGNHHDKVDTLRLELCKVFADLADVDRGEERCCG